MPAGSRILGEGCVWGGGGEVGGGFKWLCCAFPPTRTGRPDSDPALHKRFFFFAAQLPRGRQSWSSPSSSSLTVSSLTPLGPVIASNVLIGNITRKVQDSTWQCRESGWRASGPKVLLHCFWSCPRGSASTLLPSLTGVALL